MDLSLSHLAFESARGIGPMPPRSRRRDGFELFVAENLERPQAFGPGFRQAPRSQVFEEAHRVLDCSILAVLAARKL